MSLQIWLPLNGNLINQGPSGVLFSAYNSTTGLGVNSSGKITQKCYERTAAAANGYRSNKNFKFANDVSMCCWAYVSSLPGDSANGLITNHSHSDGSGFGITVKQISSTDYRISCSEGRTGSDRTYHTYYGTTNIKDAWHHLTLTYNRSIGELKLYVDGACEKTLTGKTTAVGENPFDLFNWSTAHIGNASYRAICKLNDVRVYDHCMTEREISEVSKGLAAHYLLNGFYGAQPNLLKNSYTLTGMTTAAGVEVSGPDGLIGSRYNNTSGASYKDAWDWGSIIPVSANEVYTLTFYGKTETTGTVWPFFYNNSTGVQVSGIKVNDVAVTSRSDGGVGIVLTTEWKKYKVTWTFNNNTTSLNKRLMFRINAGNDISICLPKLEKGDSTSWAPCVDDNFYILTTTEYDRSGYGNDGVIIGSPTLSSDAPVYECSTVFAGSQAIACGRNSMLTDAITVNLWGYMDDWSTFSSMRIMSCTEGGGWNFENVGHFICYANGAYQRASGNISTADAGWHMLTGTWDGKQAKIYIDGILKASSTALSTKYPITYNASNGIFIGAEASANATTPTSPYFKGKISDVRIFGTALSAEDILDMYKTPISISKNGSVFCKGLEEV